MKKCPFCAEEIQDDAIYCRYCKRNINTGKSSDKIPVIIFVVMIFFVVGITITIFYILQKSNYRNNQTNRELSSVVSLVMQITATSTPTPLKTLSTPIPTKKSTTPTQNKTLIHFIETQDAIAEKFRKTSIAKGECLGFNSVRISDVGKTMCVWDVIESSEYNSIDKAYIIRFSDKPSTLFIYYYKVPGNEDLTGKFIMVTAKVMSLGDVPYMEISDGDNFRIRNPTFP